MPDLSRLAAFLEKTRSEVYSEPPTEVHTAIIPRMLDYACGKFSLAAGARVLDVGCGQGVALEIFTRWGFSPVGVTLSPEDARVCRERGFDVLEMDQSFLEFPDAGFDLLWCRHCLEHSLFPYFTLGEFKRVLRPGGFGYFEVPAPDTSSRHQSNANHYSVLGKSMWLELMRRSGFFLIDQVDLSFSSMAGPDVYWAFLLRKEA